MLFADAGQRSSGDLILIWIIFLSEVTAQPLWTGGCKRWPPLTSLPSSFLLLASITRNRCEVKPARTCSPKGLFLKSFNHFVPILIFKKWTNLL